MKADFFPRGDTQLSCNGNISDWRELSLALHLIKQAVNPVLGMKKMLNNWREISNTFQEKRTRKLRIEEFCALS